MPRLLGEGIPTEIWGTWSDEAKENVKGTPYFHRYEKALQLGWGL